MMTAKRIERLVESNEVARNELRALVNQLIEGMLAVGSWLSPVDRSGLVIDLLAMERDVLAVAFHGQLLEIRWKAFEVLLVRQYRHRLRPEEVVVPDSTVPGVRADFDQTARCGSA